MKAKNQDSTLSYLSEIPQAPLLTRDEEEGLVKNLEIYQNQILEGLLESRYSKLKLRRELIRVQNLLDRKDKSIINMTKHLDEHSTEKQIARYETILNKLIVELERDESTLVGDLLKRFSISADIVYSVVTLIKKDFHIVYQVEQNSYSVMKWFEGKTPENILDMISQIRRSESIRSGLRLELRLTETQMLNKCTEWETALNAHKKAQNSLEDGVTFEEVRRIHKNINTSEHKALKFRDELITRNLRLVIARARKFINRGLDFEDLIQEGNSGLIRAVDKYELSRGVKLGSHATWWIDQAIARGISDKAKTVRIPTHIEYQQTQIYKATKELTGMLGRPPSDDEVAVKSGLEVRLIKDLQTRALHSVSLEEDLLSPGLSLLDILPSDPTMNPQNMMEQKIQHEGVRKLLSTLSPTNEKILRLRFGLGEITEEVENDDSLTEDELSLQIIGNHMGLTKQAIRRNEKVSLEKLRKKMKKMTFKDF